LSPSAIARILNRHRSTILREVERNRATSDGTYRPQLADWYARGRRSRSRRNCQFGVDDFKLVERLLRKKWSPEQISGRLREDGTLSISHETIYRHTWNDKAAGGGLYKHLRCAAKKRRKRHNSYDSRGRLAGKRHISERPSWVEKRKSIGHWEVDTVVGAGSKDCVTTLVERKTGLTMIGKLPDRCKLSMSKRLRSLIRREKASFNTITADNGTEFHDYESVEQATHVKFYFATPYHSWERGSNENLNGLLRQYLPKRSDLANLTQRQCDAIARELNTRPRKRLGYRTPEECFYGI
jgi:IS30 family transposase